ncbi:MAG TPA: helix-turn-helix transcriptional regulator [Alicyclobacillus sp.]|nr:helix-turn-helix transcriptional regulator [Alicyclobacillus sp.]
MATTKLREFRKNLGITQSRLAVLTQIPQTTISGWERGIGEPTVSEAYLLAKALNTTIEDLFEFRNSRTGKARARKAQT